MYPPKIEPMIDDFVSRLISYLVCQSAKLRQLKDTTKLKDIDKSGIACRYQIVAWNLYVSILK